MNEQPTDENKLGSAIQLLAQEIYNCSWYFTITRILGEQMQESGLTKGKRLFGYSFYACRRETLLSLSRIFDTSKDSISLNYLDNLARDGQNHFNNADANRIAQLLSKIKEIHKQQQPVIDKIKPIRDMALAHLDRKHINDPAMIIPTPVSMDEIETCIVTTSNLINDFMGAFNESSIPNIDPKEVISAEISVLLG